MSFLERLLRAEAERQIKKQQIVQKEEERAQERLKLEADVKRRLDLLRRRSYTIFSDLGIEGKISEISRVASQWSRVETFVGEGYTRQEISWDTPRPVTPRFAYSRVLGFRWDFNAGSGSANTRYLYARLGVEARVSVPVNQLINPSIEDSVLDLSEELMIGSIEPWHTQDEDLSHIVGLSVSLVVPALSVSREDVGARRKVLVGKDLKNGELIGDVLLEYYSRPFYATQDLSPSDDR